jgi:hypothetical protein
MILLRSTSLLLGEILGFSFIRHADLATLASCLPLSASLSIFRHCMASSSPVAPLADAPNTFLPTTLAALSSPKSCVVLALVAIAYGLILFCHTRYTFWNYRAGSVRIGTPSPTSNSYLSMLT